MEKVEISKVTLKVGGKDIELTLEQARELKEVLNKLFTQEIVINYPPVTYPYPHSIKEYSPGLEVWCDKHGTLSVDYKS